MKCEIDVIGSLQIWRNDQFKIALCPYSHAGANQSGEHTTLGFGSRPCGDWCPMFVESGSNVTICNSTVHMIVKDLRIPKQMPEEK